VQVDDGSSAATGVPIITDLDLAGSPQSPTIWTGRDNGDVHEDLEWPRMATVWTDTIGMQTVEADGVLAFVTLDLSASPTGTWSVSVANTLAGSTELVTAASTHVNGSITIVDSALYQSTTVDIAVVPVKTPTDLSGTTYGELPDYPAASADLDEWGPFWFEVWAKSKNSSDGVSHIAVDILYDDTMFQLGDGAAEPGPAFVAPGGIAAAQMESGTIHVQASTDLSDIGDNDYVLVGRIPMEGLAGIQGVDVIASSEDFTTTTGSSLVQLESGAGGIAVQAGTNVAAFAPVTYDLSDNGQVDITDLAFFASFYGQDVSQGGEPLAMAADFYGDGKIDILDLSWFAANFGKQPGDTISFPPAVPAPMLPPAPMQTAAMLPPVDEPSNETVQAALLPEEPESTDVSIVLPEAIQSAPTPPSDPEISPADADVYYSQSQDEQELPIQSQSDESASDDALLIDPLGDDLIDSLL